MIKKLLNKIENVAATKVLRWLYEHHALTFKTYKDTNMMCVHTRINFLDKEIEHITWTDLEIYDKRNSEFTSR